MNSSTECLYDNTENLCYELLLNLSNISYNNIPNRNTHFLRLSQNSSSYWITITILFFFISFDFIIFILKNILLVHNLNRQYIEIIDFTDENEYRSLHNQEFQLRYGQRSSIHNEKPYHLYRYFIE
ncbi:unnamed protein product [Rotaria sordida]|uniref:Uncharacterized protein n=1 Tax=Rotaria sordida TaxID=392033 RepID=A0A814QVQ1_9BILA|nr:unnamed protein product [Rotaria sordida]CAF1010122.1 unnamed protein product [Rotaria sordida]CAF1124884.1 unnamed protein product [Rotaria sordida]CAF1237662.1 unnamed protein product [Rotaria sordida]CAF1344756.1 unnamed protein product [Rotaria sordida]